MNRRNKYVKAGRWFILALSIFLCNYELTGQGIFPRPKFVVKFHTTKEGFILVDATFSKRERGVFLLDSGSNTAVVDQRTAHTFALESRLTSRVDVQGNGPTRLSSQSWAHIKIAQKKVILAEGDFPSLDLGSIQEGIGVPIAGILGTAVLEKYIVSIDYSKGELSFFDSTRWDYKGDGQTFTMRDSGTTHMFVIDGSVVLANCETIPLRLSIDSGSNYDLVFNHHFLESHPLIPPSSEPHNEKSASIGSGGLDGKWVDLNSLMIGGFQVAALNSLALKKDSTSILDQFADASIGSEILQQFKVIIDVPESKIIFEQRRDVPLQVAKPCR